MQNRLIVYNLKKSIAGFFGRISGKDNSDSGEKDFNSSEFDVHIDENIFLHSLHYMNENDIELNETAKNVKKPQPDVLKYIVLSICACVFIYSSYSIVLTLISYARAYVENQELRSIFHELDSLDAELPTAQMTKINKPLQDFLSAQKQSILQPVEAETSVRMSEVDQNRIKLERLADINPDTYGWIKVSETNIDYVVVQTTDSEYYLTHNFYKNEQKSGAIYVDHRNTTVDGNKNTIIYGHNMGDQTMFRPLLYFGSDSGMFNKGNIEFYTKDAIYRYEIFSIYESYADSRGAMFSYITTDFNSDEEYLMFLEELKSKSKLEKDVTLTAQSRIITLSTCTNNWRDTRFAVHGVLVEVIRG